MACFKSVIVLMWVLCCFQVNASPHFDSYHKWDKQFGPWIVWYEKDGYQLMIPKDDPFIEHDYLPEPIVFHTLKVRGPYDSVILKAGVLYSFCLSQKGTVFTSERYALSNPDKLIPEAELPLDLKTKKTEVEATARYLCQKVATQQLRDPHITVDSP